MSKQFEKLNHNQRMSFICKRLQSAQEKENRTKIHNSVLELVSKSRKAK